MRSSIFLSLGAATIVSAAANYTNCCSIDPSSVEMETRLSWCRAQTNTCPTLCSDGSTSANLCDPTTLTYNCTCFSGTTPNISDYRQTLPSLECDEWVSQCVNHNPDNPVGQSFCHGFICGHQLGSSDSAASTTAATSAASASGTGKPSGTSSSSPTSTSNAAAAVIKFGRDYGTGALLAGVFAIFGLAL